MSIAPRPATTAEPAGWVQARIDGDEPGWVTRTVGRGFDAYARVFHPLGEEAERARWADVAARNGRVMHPSADWDHIRVPAGSPVPACPTGRSDGEPAWGDLAPVVLEPLCDLLAEHTNAPDHCWFAVWEGWGWWSPATSTAFVQCAPVGTPLPPIEYAPDEWQLEARAPRFSLPLGRNYLLYEGPVRDALRIGHWATADWFQPQSPSLFWPDDRAWCVATEIDFDSTLVGGTQQLVDSIINSAEIEALQIASDAPFQDTRNT